MILGRRASIVLIKSFKYINWLLVKFSKLDSKFTKQVILPRAHPVILTRTGPSLRLS